MRTLLFYALQSGAVACVGYLIYRFFSDDVATADAVAENAEKLRRLKRAKRAKDAKDAVGQKAKK